MGKKQDSTDDPTNEEIHVSTDGRTYKDTSYGLKTPETRKLLDMYLTRLTAEARGAFERGGKITFDFKRRQTRLEIKEPTSTFFEDHPGSNR